MQAVVYTEYGAPDVLQLKEVATPVPKDDEVLVKVHAASINSWDWDLLKGDFVNRLIFGGFRRPKLTVLGCDVAGQVEAVGKNVQRFQPGDAVFGDISEAGWGAFAEYVAVRETALTIKPAGMSFVQAAAIPQAGVLAYQGLCDKRTIQPGQTVLINGAGGGVGAFAIQMAKHFGAEVTGVDSTEKLAFMRALGADHVIDYTEEDFTQTGQQYDLILDVVARRSLFDYKRTLSATGSFVIVGGSMTTILQAVTVGTWLSRSGQQKLGILVHRPNKEMASILALWAAGKVTPVIDRCYPLAETADAFRYFGAGHVKGKLIITVA